MTTKKSRPPLELHRDHQVEIRDEPRAHHAGYYFCRSCQKHISWIGHKQLALAREFNMVQSKG